MFWEMLFGYIIAGFIGAAAICILAGYLVLNGDIKITTAVKETRKKKLEKKLAKAEAKNENTEKTDD